MWNRIWKFDFDGLNRWPGRFGLCSSRWIGNVDRQLASNGEAHSFEFKVRRHTRRSGYGRHHRIGHLTVHIRSRRSSCQKRWNCELMKINMKEWEGQMLYFLVNTQSWSIWYDQHTTNRLLVPVPSLDPADQLVPRMSTLIFLLVSCYSPNVGFWVSCSENVSRSTNDALHGTGR